MSIRLSLGLAGLLLLTGGASAQTPLFQGAGARLSDLTPVETMRLDAVQADGSARATEIVTANPAALLAGGEVEISVGSSRIALRPDVLKTLDDGTTVWTSHRESTEHVEAVFTVRNGVLAGDLWLDGVRHAVRPLSDSRYVISTGVEEFVIDTDDDLARLGGKGSAEPSSVAEGQPAARRGGTTITLMVAYTSALADVLYDPVLIAQQLVAYTNVAYAQSGIPLSLRLVHTYEDPTIPVYTDIGDYLDAITNGPVFQGSTATPNDGIADAAVGLRNTFGADLVSLFHTFDNSGTAGLAGVCVGEGAAFSAVEAQGTFAAGVFAHELGHNLGSGHQNGAGDGCSGVSYAHAWSEAQAANNPSGTDWRTTMWASIGPTVVQRFSNDALTFTNDGDAAAPLGDAAQADNARLFSERAATVAAFRGDAGQAIATLTISDDDGTVEQGSIATATLTVQNTGAGPLSFDAPLHRPSPSDPIVSSQSFASIRGSGTILAMDEGTCATTPPQELALANKYDTVALPFDFPFDGQAYASVRVSGQGFVTVGTDDGCPPSPPSIPSASAPNGLISAFWSDDVGAYNFGTPSAVVTQDLGDGRFAIEWSRYGIPTGSGSFNLESAQVILSSTGTIEIVYDGSLGFYIVNDRIDEMTIGVESTDGTTGTQIPLSDFQSNSSVSFISSVLTLATQSGAVGAGTSTDVPVTIDAANLTPGDYTFSLVVHTNDPVEQTVTLPIDITVVAPTTMLADGAGWRLLAPPLAGMTVETIAAQNLVQGVPANGATPGYYADFGANLFTDYTGSAYVGAGSRNEVLESGRGFFWYLYDNDVTPDPNEGSVSVALPADLDASGATVNADAPLSLHADGDGWNMMGNPYTAALDVSGIAGWATSGAFASSVVQMYRSGAYVLSTNTGDQVEPWEGFFLQNDTAPGLAVPLSARVSAGAFARRAETRRLALRLDGVDSATGASVQDEALTLFFTEAGADGWDLWDAEKLENPAWPSLIAGFEGVGSLSDSEVTVWKAQESRTLDPEDFSVPIRIGSSGFAGPAELSWPTLALLPAAWSLTLVDHETSQTIDLRTADRYVFDVSAESSTRTRGVVPGAKAAIESGTARFTLSVSSGQAVAVEDASTTTRLTAVYPNPITSRATVAFTLAQAQSVRIRVVDALGRVIHRRDIGDRPAGPHTVQWDASGVAPGLYLVEVSTPGERMSRSVVVQR